MDRTILLVEDDDEIRKIQKDYLNASGFSVLEADNGLEGYQVWKSNKVDLIVLDLNLPVVDGIEVCKKIRTQNTKVPIIMVTARSKESDELLGLDIGADDYVKKPFSPRVLTMRIKNLVNKQTGNKPELILGELKVNFENQIVKKNNKVIPLTTIQFGILQILIQNTARVFSRSELIDKGYYKSIPPEIMDRTVDSHVKNIRRLIEDNPKSPQYILTVRGRGYKFNEQLS